MAEFWLDTNVFIQAKNGPYGFDILPAFWDWLDESAEDGTLCSSTIVYDELVNGKDDLADWVKERKNSGLFVKPDSKSQKGVRRIADYVKQKYAKNEYDVFLAGADPWVIAQAKDDEATVVTHEVRVPKNSRKIKIPNVCAHFDIGYIHLYAMLRQLRVSFGA